MDKINQYINDKYVKTDNKKDCIKMKDIFNKFKDNDIYANMTNEEKRNLTYKKFNTAFLKNYVRMNKDKTLCLYKHKLKTND
jgi:hypothetical protein